MEPLARKFQTVGASVPSVKSMIASLQSVLNQDLMDFTTVASNPIFTMRLVQRLAWKS